MQLTEAEMGSAKELIHSSLTQLIANLIQSAQHAILLVDIYSDVVHENSVLSSSNLRTGMLFSFYRTPVLAPFPLQPPNQL